MMQIFETKVPPLLLTLLCALAMWLVAYYFPREGLYGSFLRFTLSGLLLLAGLIFLFGGALRFRQEKTSMNPIKPESASKLVVSGLYRLSRNPVYLGMALCLMAWAVYLASIFAFSGPVLFILYMNRFQIVPEERALERIFAQDYLAYKNRVRRWI